LDKAASWLKSALDYEFSDLDLLAQALTHRSAPGRNNERLEFLGDAVLDTVISEVVFQQRPEASEGALSRLRSSLVKDVTLAEVAADLAVGEHLTLGAGERKSGGQRRASILADALEAIIGAVYLDAGYQEAQRIVRNAFGDRLTQLPDAAELRDPKTRLQELLQSRKIDLPAYDVMSISGKAHQQSFTVSCKIEELDLVTQGEGSTRRDAEQQAAREMLEQASAVL
jgi:ribonuclease-3